MITGFNTNVRHAGRTFHVQTEDSGRSHPHVISHLYCGGTILATEKRDYAEHLDTADLQAIVRGLMQEQHRAILERLAGGEFDAVITERLGGDTAAGSTASEPAAPAPEPTVATAAEAAPAAAARAFGDGIVSEKPLDEVVLEYLVDKSRSRGAR